MTEDGTPVKHIADEVAEELGVDDFIEKHLETLIGPKLVAYEDSAINAPVNDDMMFFALTLPIMNSVIHIASNQSKLDKALDVVRERWRGLDKDTEVASTLSALMLIHVVWKGWEHFSRKRDNLDKWKSMLKRVKRLVNDMEAEATST